MTHIIVASASKPKIEAVRAAFAAANLDVLIEAVRTTSGVPEQPLREQTLQGALTRIEDARAKRPGADIYVGIENGLFIEDGRVIDKACVVLSGTDAQCSHIAYSEGVEFPRDAFEEAQRRGFTMTTVGHILHQRGLVSDYQDPHASLTGRPRADYIREAVLESLNLAQNFSANPCFKLERK